MKGKRNKELKDWRLSMNTQYPNHYIYLKQINKNQWAIVFRRNNLSKNQFIYDYDNEVFTYKETFNNINSHISFGIIIKSKVFYDIFCAECDYFKATGGYNGFGIYIQTKAMTVDEIMYRTISKTIKEDNEFIKYDCSYKGTFHTYQLYNNKHEKLDKTAAYNKYKNNKMKNDPRNKLKSKKQNKTIIEIPYEKVENSKNVININLVKGCVYFENKICTYFNDICNPYSVRCKNPNILYQNKKNTENRKIKIQNDIVQTSQKLSKGKKYVKTVILLHNRKCIYKEHSIIDVDAIIKVLTPNNKVIDSIIPAAYCEECNQYIILKTDYEQIKKKGTLLCVVIDKTPEYIVNHKKPLYSTTESKVHKLGYNVIKQYAYTFEQRKIILANIIENHDISKHEILSMLDANIARKIGLSNYSTAVSKWKQDRDYVTNYKHGDCPEVIIDKVIISSRSE